MGSFGVLKRGLVYPGKNFQQAPNQSDTRESSELTKNKFPTMKPKQLSGIFGSKEKAY